MSDFQITPKKSAGPRSVWIFQGNPNRFDIDDYLSRYTYIYWRCPKHRSDLRVADPCIIWRAGAAAGVVAVGRVAEAPKALKDASFPECLGEDLWRDEPDSPETIKVGIEIDEVRLDEEAGYIPRSVFLESSVLSNSLIIRSPQGTVFRLGPSEADEAFALWIAPVVLSTAVLPEALEGAQRLRRHYARERNGSLIKKKKRHFAAAHDGKVFCVGCANFFL